MARSRASGRRTAAGTSQAPETPPALGASSAPSLASATLPRVWQGVGYRPLSDPAPARRLFDFAAVPWPGAPVELCWGAFQDDGLVGGVAGERAGRDMMLHGPVAVSAREPLEVAAQLVAVALDHARALGVETLFTRPQGLDRVWVRFGFLPVPETALPPALRERPGSGLYAWRGGSALWTFRESPRD